MIGRRDPALPQQATGLAPVHVGQVDVQQDQVGADLAAHAHPLGGRRGLDRAELLVQGQLLGQGLAQVVVVVDDQDGLGCRPWVQNGEAWASAKGGRAIRRIGFSHTAAATISFPEQRRSDPHMGRPARDRRCDSRRSSPSTGRAARGRAAIRASSSKCGAGVSSTGGMHISPSTRSPRCSRAAHQGRERPAIATPAFCGSAPVLTWISTDGARPVVWIAVARAGPVWAGPGSR